MVHAVLREEVVASMYLLGFMWAQLVFSCRLVESANQVGIAVAGLRMDSDVEAQNCCHKYLEMFG